MKFIAGLALFVFLLVLGSACSQFDRVDPGYVGVIINYGDGGKISQAPTGTWQFIGPYRKLIKYPVAQVQTVMDKDPNVGDVKGDDSINCPTKGGVQLHVDATVFWRPNPNEIVDLYMLQPGVTVKDLNTNVVRRIVGSAVSQVCGEFTWEDIYALDKATVQGRIHKRLDDSFQGQHLVVDDFFLGAVYPPEAQQAQAAQLIDAQQKARVATITKSQVEAEAAANRAKVEAQKSIELTTAQAEAKIQQANAERDAAVAKVNADRDATVSRTQTEAVAANAKTQAQGAYEAAQIAAQAQKVKADADAYAVQQAGRAKAESEAALVKAYTPDFLNYMVKKAEFDKWNGQRVPDKDFYLPPGYQTPGVR